MDQGNILKRSRLNQINLDSSIQDIKKNLGKGKTK